MPIHLVSLVGGHIDLLPFMLEHYREQGVESFYPNVHMNHPADPILTDVRKVTDRFGCEVGDLVIGEWELLQEEAIVSTMRKHPDDWWVLADQDELQMYPDSLASMLAYCDRKGYDCVTGSFVDRISGDGGFPALDQTRPIGEQFPLGGIVSYSILGAEPRKVIAAKGRVKVTKGQHFATNCNVCPAEEFFIEIHHYKWTAGVVERLRNRAVNNRALNLPYWIESERFVKYVDANDGRINLFDPRLLIAPCAPRYPHWPMVVLRASRFNKLSYANALPGRRS